MLFNSLEFLYFFIVVTVLYFVLPHKYRWFLLLSASCYFYMAFIPIYILVLCALIIIDYSCGILIENSELKHKKLFLVISIVSTCVVLFIFKYFNFLNTNLSKLAEIIHWNYPIRYLSLALPIGLSFHTFQSLSYVIEVYRGRQQAEKNFGIYALYVMFYPQLVAGPIERPQNLLHQFYIRHDFDYVRVTNGLKLMLWGLFKKTVIADRLALLVNQIYSQPTSYAGLPLLLATVAFALQIYCDFSGYSEMAIGAAQVMGFKLMDNFKRPYLSKSIPEFWTRWHISLSTWFRDYLYIPLGGNRVETLRWCINIMIVFLLAGLWHGANWTFVIWGALHGLYRVISTLSQNIRNRFIKFIRLDRLPWLHGALRIIVTLILVDIGWVFFRANNISDAVYIITHLFYALSLKDFFTVNLGLGADQMVIAILAILVMETVHQMQEHLSVRQFLSEKPIWIRWPIYITFIWSIIIYGTSTVQFIYFQF